MSQTAKEPSKNNNKNTAIYVVVALLLGGSVIYSKSKKKTDSSNSNSNSNGTNGNNSATDINGSITVSPKPIAIYVTKILKIGSKGIEVQKLQALMRISADGFFGAQTEAMLFRLKGVKEISLDQYAKLPTINRNILPNGTKVMVSNKNGANVYGAIKKADGTYFSSGKIEKTIAFGQAVGTIRSQSADGNAYTVFYNDLWNGDFFTGTAVGFVNAVDIEKYK